MMRIAVKIPHGELKSPSLDVRIDIEEADGKGHLVIAIDSEFSRDGELGIFLDGGYLLGCSGEIFDAASGALSTLKSFAYSIDCDVMNRFGCIEADEKYLEYAIGLFDADPSVRLEVGDGALLRIRRRSAEFEKNPDLSMLADAELYPHQLEAVRFLRSRCLGGGGWGLLALEQGTGKTLAVIAFIVDLMSRTPYAVSLVVCPASVVGVWVEHFERHAPSLRIGVVAGSQEQRAVMIGDYENYDVLVTTLGCLRCDSLEYARSAIFDLFVVDECDALKNHSSRTRSAARRVKAARRIGLSGTPFPNSTANEIHGVLACLSTDFYLGSKVAFNERFSSALEGDGDVSMLRALKHLIEPCIMRRLKEDVLQGLPRKNESEIYVDLPEEQRAIYESFERGLRNRVTGMSSAQFEKERAHVFSALTNLRQLAVSPAAVYPDYDGPAVKVDMAVDMAKAFAEEGHKVVIFTLFVKGVVDDIRSGLDCWGVTNEALTGDVPVGERDGIIRRFSSDGGPQVLVISKAGGSGISLVSADVEIVLCPYWHLSASDQAIDRLHRIGQRNEVRAFHLLCRNTIEDRIVELRNRKQNASESIMRQGDRSSLIRMTRGELIELLGGTNPDNEQPRTEKTI